MTDKVGKILAFIEERIKWNEDMMKRDPKPSDIGRIEEAKCIRRFIDSIQEEPKMCMYTKDDFTDEDRKTLCEGCEEDCEYNKIEEPVSRTPADIEAAMQEIEEKSKAFTEAHQGEDADTILAQMRGEEPVSEDLEAEIDYLSKRYQEVSFAKLSRIAVRMAKWQKSKTIQKACEWLDRNAAKYLITDTIHGVKMTGLHASMTEDFKKYMED